MKKKYRGFTIILTQVNKDRVEYKITKDDGSFIEPEDAEGFDVELDETLETAKEVIDFLLDEKF